MVKNVQETLAAIERCTALGEAGKTILIEELLVGPEVSVFAFCDGRYLSRPVAVRDYSRLLDGDEGPNTGGVGSYGPPEFWTEALAKEATENIMQPVIDEMARRGTPFVGTLYAGLMLTADGLKVIEFNCRMGDPETQIFLPQLITDPVQIMQACVDGKLEGLPVYWNDQPHVGVVMVTDGYPGDPRNPNVIIEGLDRVDPDIQIFHGTTKFESGNVYAVAGRVLTIVGQGPTLALARKSVYDNIVKIRFLGARYRGDIAFV